jgi:hypothetical protein
LTAVTNILPFSLLDPLLVVGLVALGLLVLRTVRVGWRTRSFGPMGALLGWLAVAVAAGYLTFLAAWGLNYRRIPMANRLRLTPEAADGAAVRGLGDRAVAELNRLHVDAHAEGWQGGEWRDPVLTASAARVHAHLNGGWAARPGRLKGSLLGPYFRWTSIDGMVNPFGLDVIANPDLLPFERPFVAAHEWAHLAGFADEAAANFAGFLTTMGGTTATRYSGWLFLYWQVAGEVGSEDRAALWASMAAGPRADVEQVLERLRRGALPELRVAGWFVYDQYLKANRVDAGVRSYGEVINLLIRATFDDRWTPRLRDQASQPEENR